jgi:acetylornithine/succinyldiaminopimelate/putrescine aminotransferase
MAESLFPGAARILKGEGSKLVDERGAEYVDLSSGFGTAWLGHGNHAVRRRVGEQLDRIWSTGALETEILDQARAAVNSFFPDTHGLGMLYSTGMEAAEFAIRLARIATGRTGLVGFQGCMHGKSLMTAYLGWDNRDGLDLPSVDRLPFVSTATEHEILERVDRVLASETVAAVFIEPLQGSAGGHRASEGFYHGLYERCRARGTLLVFDEILTGFWRTGQPFFFSDLAFVPDIILVGKAIGNGFPVSAVVVDRGIAVEGRMLPGSTYSGNPLAASAVTATLEQLRILNLPVMVAEIESIIVRTLHPLVERGVQLRGRGALWILELPSGVDTGRVARRVYDCGVALSYAGRYIRILPSATIEPDRLAQALTVLAEEVARAFSAADT